MLIARCVLSLTLTGAWLAAPAAAWSTERSQPSESLEGQSGVSGGQDDLAPARDRTEAEAAESDDDDSAAPGERGTRPMPEVELLEAGSEPRAVVRYAPQPGAEQRVLMTIDMTSEQTAMGMNTPPTDVPRTLATFRTTVREADAGSIHYVAELQNVEVAQTGTSSPTMVSRLQRLLSVLKGMKINVTATDRGIIRKVSTEGAHSPAPTPLDNHPNLPRAFTESVVVLPEEAIGEGARWKVVALIDADGIRAAQTTTYSLKKIDGDDYILDVTVEQTAEEQEIRVSNLPGRMKLRLVSLDASGAGTMVVKPGLLTPLTADLRMTTHLESLIEPNGIAMDQKVESRTRFEPTEVPKDSQNPSP